MDDTTTVLLVINKLTPEQINTITTFANMPGNTIDLSLLYVKPETSMRFFQPSAMTNLSWTSENTAQETLVKLGQAFKVPPHKQWLATGNVRKESQRLAEKLNAQLITETDIANLLSPSHGTYHGEASAVSSYFGSLLSSFPVRS
jgi:hypothetical protein